MARYEATVDEEGRLVLPPEISRKVGARPGDRLDIAEIASSKSDHSRGLSIRLVAERGRRIGATADVPASDGNLDALKVIARRAREAGARTSDSPDPIGDYLLEEDDRSRGL